RSAFRLQQFADPFFSAIPLRTLCLCVKILLAFLGSRLGGRRAALPSDHSLRPSASSLHLLSNFNEAEPLQPLQRRSLNTELCRRAERHCSFPFFQLREKRRLSIRKPMRQFAAAQAGRRITPSICQKNLPLRF